MPVRQKGSCGATPATVAPRRSEPFRSMAEAWRLRPPLKAVSRAYDGDAQAIVLRSGFISSKRLRITRPQGL